MQCQLLQSYISLSFTDWPTHQSCHSPPFLTLSSFHWWHFRGESFSPDHPTVTLNKITITITNTIKIMSTNQISPYTGAGAQKSFSFSLNSYFDENNFKWKTKLVNLLNMDILLSALCWVNWAVEFNVTPHHNILTWEGEGGKEGAVWKGGGGRGEGGREGFLFYRWAY